MPIKTIFFDGEEYPAFQAEGFAAKFCFPFAEAVCIGKGLDVGCNRKEWAFPGAIPIDPQIKGCKYDAFKLPNGKYDYIISSHMLEHVVDWVGCLDYWFTKIKEGGYLFLYLPSYSQKYWRPWNNRKHVHIFSQQILTDYLTDRGWEGIMTTGDDANNSFTVIAQKPLSLSSIGVYSITNIFNNKRYIGSTTVSFHQRFIQHKSELLRNDHHSYLLQRAYNKYGLNAFRFQILEDCSGMILSEMLERESFYIKKYNSFNGVATGYNVKEQPNGNTREFYQKILLFDIDGNLQGEFNSAPEVAKKIGCTSSAVQGCYDRQKEGKYSSIYDAWIAIKKEHLDKAVFDYSYTIYEMDDNGKEIQSFKKYQDAGDSLNISRETVRKIVLNKLATSRGTFLILKNRKYPIGSRTKK